MTDWTLETLEDFDGVFFDAGMGWRVLFEIHFAIRLRAIATLHPVRLFRFSDNIPSIVWIDDTEDDFDLRTELESCYEAITLLLSGDDGVRWTIGSGRSDEWTIESMTADIGMGEFSDLLIRSQSPEPLVWLIGAINRLTHPKLKRTISFSGNRERPDEWNDTFFDGSPSDGQEAWDVLLSGGTGSFFVSPRSSLVIRWRVYRSGGNNYAEEYPRTNGLLVNKPIGASGYLHQLGTILDVDYIATRVASAYVGPDWDISIGTSESTRLNAGTFATQTTIEETGLNLPLSDLLEVNAVLDTEKPETVPFNGLITGDYGFGFIDCTVSIAWLYCDLPEVMGAGKLTAAISTVSATAEQEE